MNAAVTNGYAKRDVIYMVVRKKARIVQHFLPESSTKHVTEHCKSMVEPQGHLMQAGGDQNVNTALRNIL